MAIIQENGKINFHVVNFAKRRGLDLTLETPEDQDPQIWIWDAENDCEPVLMYAIQESTDSLFYRGSLMRSLEDLPHWVENADKLKKLVDYVADMVKADKM